MAPDPFATNATNAEPDARRRGPDEAPSWSEPDDPARPPRSTPTNGQARVPGWPPTQGMVRPAQAQTATEEPADKAPRRVKSAEENVPQTGSAPVAPASDAVPYHALIDALPSPVLLIDRFGKVRYVNPEAMVLLGNPLDRLVGRRIHDIFRVATDSEADPIATSWARRRPLKDVPGRVVIDQAEIPVSVSTGILDQPEGPLLLIVLRNQSKEQAVMRTIRDVAKRTSTTAADIAARAETTNSSVQAIREALNQIADGTQVQADKVEETVDIIKDLARSIDSINEHVNQAADGSAAVAQRALEGTRVVGTALDQLDKITQGVNASARMVTGLNDQIDKAGRIIDFVQEISQKTNLLALNAGIEAARAGEHGRAFAVVADEVKRLSEHTRESIREVSGIVEQLRAGADAVIAAIQERNAEVQASAEVVASALQTIREVADGIQTSNELVRSIHEKTALQKQGASRIVTAVDEVAAVAEDASSSTERTSRLADDVAGGVTALTEATHSLTMIAHRLHGTLDDYFRAGEAVGADGEAVTTDRDADDAT